MLAIRMQRTGRRGHAMFRVVVQDAHRTPTSGKVVARLGSYDPHAKTVILDKEKAAFYLEHGAQPSDSIARLLKKEGVKLPKWVKQPTDKKRDIRNADKRRSTRPPEAEASAAPAETPAETSETAEPAETATEAETPATEAAEAADTAETSAETPAEKPAETEAPAESAEKPAEEAADKPE